MEAGVSAQQEIAGDCATVDCRSCGAVLIGPHYHLYGVEIADNMQIGRDYIGCLCFICYQDIMDMIQSYIGD